MAMSGTYNPEWISEEDEKCVEKRWKAMHLIQYQGFWMRPKLVPCAVACSQHFEARNDDSILVTYPKSGTTWMKALAFTLVNRSRHDLQHHPLLTTTPQDVVPFLELELYAKGQIPDLTNLFSPRLFASHLPYPLLPRSIMESDCRIVYLWRNPKDVFVSMWHFANKFLPEDVPPCPIEEAFDLFCRGISPLGPFWEHVLGYFKTNLERPGKILVLKYEEMKEDPVLHLRRLADFLGCPFSVEEDRKGVAEEISHFCSYESLRNLVVNRSGRTRLGPEGKDFFRRGVVGDSEKHLTAEMLKRLDQIIQQKFMESGLVFKQS